MREVPLECFAPDVARCNGVDADALWSELAGEGLRHREQRRLGDLVAPVLGLRVPDDGGVDHHYRAAGFGQGRGEQLAEPKCAEQRQLEAVADDRGIGVREILHRRVREGIVDQGIDMAECVDGRGDQGRRRVLVRDIGGHRDCSAPQRANFPGHRLHTRGGASREDNICAGGGALQRARSTEGGADARDHDHLAGERAGSHSAGHPSIRSSTPRRRAAILRAKSSGVIVFCS